MPGQVAVWPSTHAEHGDVARSHRRRRRRTSTSRAGARSPCEARHARGVRGRSRGDRAADREEHGVGDQRTGSRRGSQTRRVVTALRATTPRGSGLRRPSRCPATSKPIDSGGPPESLDLGVTCDDTRNTQYGERRGARDAQRMRRRVAADRVANGLAAAGWGRALRRARRSRRAVSTTAAAWHLPRRAPVASHPRDGGAQGADPLRRRRHPPAPDHAHLGQAARASGQQARALLRDRGAGRGRDHRDRDHRSRPRPATRSARRPATARGSAPRSPTSPRTSRSASRTRC